MDTTKTIPTPARARPNRAQSPEREIVVDAKDDSLEGITRQMISSLNLQEVLTAITQGLVDELDAAFARIWLLGPGDLCDSCYQIPHCQDRERCLHLEASAGLYVNINGEYRRIPLGALKIGRIAQGAGPMYTSDVLADNRLPNKAWMRETGLRSFAGYPLLFRGELLGVMAMFSRHVMSEGEFSRLQVFANHAAIAIKNAQLFSEVETLKNRLQAENRYLNEEIKAGHNFSEIIGKSQSLQKVLSKVKQVAPTEASVLIHGETGTGKELIARAIHNFSPRKKRPLIKVNCAALPSGLIESELFGHEKGAFTGALARRTGRFELADGGTVFLDEVGDLPLELQSKLLRVLQEQEFERVGGTKTIKVDARVIAATHRNLDEAVARDQFRADLYYRLNVFPVEIPPLRERKEDIALLARYFVQKCAAATGKRIESICERVIEQLAAYDWPGNIRELENVIERAVILSSGPKLQLDESFEATSASAKEPDGSTATLEEVDRRHILRVLESTNWVIEGNQAAAVRLGLNPSTLRSRMEKLGIKKASR